MAKKIRFPLKMKNGAEVRTLDELKENFNLESVLGYFTDGRLYTWLTDRYYDEKAEAVSALSADMPDLNAKLCEILEVEYQAENDETDVELIARRREKLRILGSVTDDKDVLNNVDLVAMDQDELFDILDESPEKVYLYGEKFSIPIGAKNITYVGINTPLVILEKRKYLNDYKLSGIHFENVEYEDGVDNSYEQLFVSGKPKEAFSTIQKAANNGNPRAMYIMARYYQEGYEVVKINKDERDKWCERAYSYKEPLSMYGYATWFLKDGSEEKNRIYDAIFEDILLLAESGDTLAQGIIGYMYDNGCGVVQDKSLAVQWIMEAAKNGYPYAQNYLGWMYDAGNGIDKDKIKAVEWYTKAAEQGFADAQYNLGVMYSNGIGIAQDYSEAFKWFKKSAEQGIKEAQNELGDCYYFGDGVYWDKSEAIKWYKLSAEQGFPDAQCNLGYMYMKGEGTSTNQEEGLRWFKKAADNGDELAKNNIEEYRYKSSLDPASIPLFFYKRHKSVF